MRCDPMTGTRYQRQPAVAVFAALALAATSVHAEPRPKQLVAELKALGAQIVAEDEAARYTLPCHASPQRAGLDKLLSTRAGHAVTITQLCDGDHGTLVSFFFTAADRHTAQIARVIDPSTVIIIATWKDMKNCDSGMCDHFSKVDSLTIRNVADLDGDGILDPLVDFATTIGDQGREEHRFALWLSATKHLYQLGAVRDRIDWLETFPDRSGIGVAVSTRTLEEQQERHCFHRSGAMRTCPASVQAAWSKRERRLAIAGEWSNYTDDTVPPDAKTLASSLTELGVTADVMARLSSLAAPTKP